MHRARSLVLADDSTFALRTVTRQSMKHMASYQPSQIMMPYGKRNLLDKQKHNNDHAQQTHKKIDRVPTTYTLLDKMLQTVSFSYI